MKKIYELTQQEVGDALTEYLGKYYENLRFFPFIIKETNIELPMNITIELEVAPKGSTVQSHPHLFKRKVK